MPETYLLVGDIHLSDREPSSMTESYLDDLFVLLEHTVRIAEEQNVAAVVWSGDVFHHKTPSKNSHRLVMRAAELVKRYKRLLIVPGNHDMLQDRFDSIASTQPLGVLFEAGAELLNGWESTGEHPLYGIPWNQKWDEDTVSDSLRDWRDPGPMHGTIADSLVIAHAPLYPPSMENPFEYYPTRDQYEDETVLRRGWSSLMGNAGSCYYGHVHDAHGTYEVEGVTYCNQGAITRGSLHESDVKRAIAVTTWSPGVGFQRVEVPHRPADEIYRVMEIREREDKQVELDAFLASVGETSIEITSIEAVTKTIEERDDLDAAVRKVAIELLQAASH